MSRKTLIIFILLIIGLGAMSASGQEYSKFGNPLARLTVKDVPVLAEVVGTPEKVYLGLGRRKELPEGRGMLFLMPQNTLQLFCMRDMLISIDIIWIADGKVAGIHKQLSPADKGSFCSPVPVRLVLEVPGGFADLHGIKVGDPVKLQSPGLSRKTP